MVGTMRLKRLRAVDAHQLRAVDPLAALVDRQPERLPDLLAEEAVAQQVAALDHELLALVALLVA